MKIGKLMTTNIKGQIVIPQEYRESLGITPEVVLNITLEKSGLFVQPIQKIIPKMTSENMYATLLKKTAGAWDDDSFKRAQNAKSKIEIEAAKKRRQPW